MNISFPTDGTDVSYVEYNGKRFDLLQFHFHTASEHTVDGHFYIAEVHHVHAVSGLAEARKLVCLANDPSHTIARYQHTLVIPQGPGAFLADCPEDTARPMQWRFLRNPIFPGILWRYLATDRPLDVPGALPCLQSSDGELLVVGVMIDAPYGSSDNAAMATILNNAGI